MKGNPPGHLPAVGATEVVTHPSHPGLMSSSLSALDESPFDMPVPYIFQLFEGKLRRSHMPSPKFCHLHGIDAQNQGRTGSSMALCIP